MKWVPFVLGQSRGLSNAATRLPTIMQRFGWTAEKSNANLTILLDIADRYAMHPTFAVTAATARRHPRVVEWLLGRGAEVAAHGYVHNDFAALSEEEQCHQMTHARRQLTELGAEVRGWRSPYFRWNAHTQSALRASGFAYDSTAVCVWPVYEEEGIVVPPAALAAYGRLCDLFHAQDTRSHVVLPTITDGLVQVPASLPQDEDMVDRLRLDGGAMTRVWQRVLHDARERGELFVINLHPERAALCAEPLEATLGEARRLGDVWLATLGEIADWWRARDGAQVTVESAGDGRWQIAVDGPPHLATLFGQQVLTGPGPHAVLAPSRPVVHCGPGWAEATRQRLRDAGYVLEQGAACGAHCAVDLDTTLSNDTPPDRVVREVDRRQASLVRLHPWPAGYRSCASLTGDIDALTLVDFALRLKEF